MTPVVVQCWGTRALHLWWNRTPQIEHLHTYVHTHTRFTQNTIIKPEITWYNMNDKTNTLHMYIHTYTQTHICTYVQTYVVRHVCKCRHITPQVSKSSVALVRTYVCMYIRTHVHAQARAGHCTDSYRITHTCTQDGAPHGVGQFCCWMGQSHL